MKKIRSYERTAQPNMLATLNAREKKQMAATKVTRSCPSHGGRLHFFYNRFRGSAKQARFHIKRKIVGTRLYNLSLFVGSDKIIFFFHLSKRPNLHFIKSRHDLVLTAKRKPFTLSSVHV